MTVLAGLLLAAIFAALSLLIWRNYQSDRDTVERGLLEEANLVSGNIDQYVRGQVAILQAIAASPAVQTADAATITPSLKALDPARLGFGSVNWADPAGVLRATSSDTPGAVPLDISDRQHFRDAAATKRPVVGDAIVVRVNPLPTLVFAVPVLNAEGVLTGMLQGATRLDASSTLPPIVRGPSPGLFVLDRSGQIIVAEGPITELKKVHPQALQALAGQQSVVSSTGVSGASGRVLAFTRAPESGWTVVREESESSAYGHARDALRNELVGAGLACLLLFTGVAISGQLLDRRNRATRIAQFERDNALDRYAALTNSMTPIVLETAPAGAVVFANQRWRQYTGLPAEGELWRDSVHPDDRALPMPETDLPGGTDSWQAEVRLRRLDGTYRWHLARTVPTAARGAQTDWITTLVDIDDLKRLEFERSARLTDQDAFLGLLAHELRSPLAALTGYAALLQRRIGDLSESERDEALAEVVEGGGRLERILVNMLRLARLESFDPDSLEPVLIARLAGTIVARVRAESPTIAFVLTADDGGAAVLADPTGIEQVVINFLSNALKYGKPAGRIEVLVRHQDAVVELTVTDDGPGMSDQEIARLFQPFFRTPSARRTAPGLGLGLLVSKRIIEAYGGSIFARPAPDGGMVFGFTLPAMADEDDDGGDDPANP